MKPDDPDSPAPICVLVVDDHPAVRAGLSLLVSSQGLETCGEAAGRQEALTHTDQRRPDLAIVDLSLDGEDGLLLVTDMVERRVPVLVYSMHSDADHVQDALAAGALGYVTKSEIRDVLMEGIREVRSGRRFVSPRAASALAERLAGRPTEDPVETLSSKEREVFRRLGTGDGTLEIAAGMRISTHTVESYYARIQLKLGVQGMYELRHRAIETHRRRYN